MDITDQLDILNSDPRLLDLTKRRPAGNNKFELALPSELFPDDRPFSALVEGDINFAVLQAWLTQVRSEWNARQASKEAEALIEADARRAAVAAEAQRSVNGGGGPVPAKDDNQECEASLEETLRSQIAKLVSGRSRWADIACSAKRQLDEASDKLDRYDRDIFFANKMLKELQGDPSEDSTSDSIELSPEEE